MELKIQQRDFLRGLARTHNVADKKNSMRILSNVLLSTEGTDKLRLSATDLYLGISSTVPAAISRNGFIAISARTLFDIVKALPEGELLFRVGENQTVTLEQGKIKYKIPGLPGDDFPPLPNPGETTFSTLETGLLSELVGLTSYSMSSDDTRPHLAGTLFERNGNTVRMVTTDGHRLSKAESSLSEEAKESDFSMLVPHKGINELKRLLEEKTAKKETVEIDVAVSAGNAFFRRDDVLLNVKLAEEQFPPYDKVIPQNQSKRVVAARNQFISSLRRISLVTSEKNGGVIQLHIEPGIMRIVSQNPDIGEGVEEVEIDYAGDNLSIGFNARYLLDALSALTYDDVALELSGELDPGIIRPVGEGTDFVGVIMPMRI